MSIIYLVLLTYSISMYITYSNANKDKFVFKIIDVVFTVVLIAIFSYGIVKFELGIILGTIFGILIAINYITENKTESKKRTLKEINKDEFLNKKILKLKKSIQEIEEENYTAEFYNGGYKYSENITCVNQFLDYSHAREYKNMSDKKELLLKNEKEYSYYECTDYFLYVWHLESSLAVGTVKKQIESGKYVRVMKKILEYLNDNA